VSPLRDKISHFVAPPRPAQNPWFNEGVADETMVWKRRIAFIDLTTKKIVAKPIPKQARQLYLGGRDIDMYLLHNHVKPKVDPLSPENILFVGTGLLCGIPALGSGRCDIAAKSPLTGAVGNSNIGGFFGPA